MKKITVITVLAASLASVAFVVLTKDASRQQTSIFPLASQDESMTESAEATQAILEQYSSSESKNTAKPAEIEQSSPSESLAEIGTAARMVEEGNLDQAAMILSELYESRSSLSESDEIELLSLYAKLLIELGSNQEAIDVLDNLLAIEDVPQDIRLEATNNLGLAFMAEEEWELAGDQFNNWLDQSEVPEPDVLLSLSYAYYQQELWTEALGPAVEHVELLIDLEEEITEERLMYLNGLAVVTEDLNNAAWITQVLISEFNRIRDWRNLIAIYSGIGNETAVEQVYRDADAAGVLEELEASYELR